MRNLRHVAMAMLVSAGISACGPPSDVKIVPPKVLQGGRAVAIAVSQSDAKRLVVATESGGLFRTFDGGVSFQHLDAFPTLFAVDVAMASLDPNVIIATARDDFATTSGGGIWLSQDGGASWKRPTGWPPALCGGRPGAAGISHMPLSRTFYVATDCGLAVSNDNGSSFTTTPIDPANPKLFSVLVVNRTTGVAADNRRTWFLNNGQWTPSLGGPDTGAVFDPHAFASPWWAADNVFYHAGRDRELWVSTTDGGAWRQMPTQCDIPPKECSNREPFVRVGRGLDGDPTHFDVYYGDGTDLWREAVTTAVPGGNVGDWRRLNSDHSDPADIAFTPGNTEPLMLATDGGVHLTKDKGKTWVLTGSNVGGFVALQVCEMTGRQVGGSSPHLDLYYGTQDNQIKGSSDGGATWNGSKGGEGAFLQVDAVNPAMVDGRVTGKSCGKPCNLFDVQPHLGQGDPGLFRDAPSGSTNNPDALAPFQLIGDTFLQPLKLPPNSEYWLTSNRGANWTQSFVVPGTHVGRILFAGDLANPVAYAAQEKNAGATLVRASGVSGTPVVSAADQIGMGTIGLLRTGQARYAVVGVDPKEPNHLLAHDLFAGTKASRDGGVTWFPLPALDAAVTDSGKFQESMNNSVPFVTTIAWDPTNSCHILVGTMQNGVIRSADGGLTWAQVPGSKNATIVTSFFFPPTGAIWMSTYGRGLWQVMSDRKPPASGRCNFPQPPGPIPPKPVIIMTTGGTAREFGGLQDEAVCATCSVLLVHDGWITDIEGDDSVRKVSTSGGYVEQRQRDGREAPATVENAVREEEGDGLRRRVGKGAMHEQRVRGLILDGNRLVAYIAGNAPLAIAPLRKPAVFVRTMPDESAQIIGFQFVPGTGDRGVTVTIEGETIATNAPVTADGKFEVPVRVRRPPGWALVSAVQRDDLRTTIATTYLQVVDSMYR